MLNIILCDDDASFLDRAASEVFNILSQQNINGKIRTYTDADLLSPQLLSSCDIALLDIDFSGADYSGLDIAERLRAVNKDAVIIFVTNYIEFAPEGYKVRAYRYLLKRDLSELQESLISAVAQLGAAQKRFRFQINGEIINPLIDSILYFEVQQHSVTLYAYSETDPSSVKQYHFYASLTDLEEQFAPHGFLRVHKSFLVNMKYIQRFQCREITLRNGMTVRVSEKSYGENKRKYLLWKGVNQ